jgi:hypothetical protein
VHGRFQGGVEIFSHCGSLILSTNPAGAPYESAGKRRLPAHAINDQKAARRPLAGLTFSFDFSDTSLDPHGASRDSEKYVRFLDGV